MMQNDIARGAGIDWATGTWRRPGAPDAAARIVIAGDWAPIRAFSDPMLANPAALYGDLLPVLRDSHLRLVNLECPLVDGGQPVHKSGAVFKGTAAHVAGLTAIPFDVATLANNHVFDYGIEGFSQTLEILDRNGIRRTGAGLSPSEARKPLQANVGGVEVGIVSFSEGEDLTAAADGKPGVFGWEVEGVVDLVRGLRPAVQIIVVVCHGGVEYIPFPPPYLAAALRRIADAGADLVIGHHPHVPQGVEIRGGVPICYSLGNFVFFQPTDLQYRKVGYLVEAGAAADGLASIRLVPYEIGAAGLSRLAGENLRRMLKRMQALSEPLGRGTGILEAWNGFLKHYGAHGFRQEIDGDFFARHRKVRLRG